MALGKKVSPAKFLGAVSLGLGVAQGATQIIGGIAERRRLKGEMQRTRKQFRRNRDELRDMQFENPYADLQTSFENPYEDLTVNQQQAQFEAEQAAQSRANILGSLRGAAGSSGIAGLAQSLANQATVDRARASASIGQQEARNQVLAAQGAAQVQAREQAAEQTVMAGEAQRKAQERQRDLQIMQLRAGKQDALAGLRQQRAEAIGDIAAGVGTMAGSAFDAYELGMDFLGKETNVTQNIGNTPRLSRREIQNLNLTEPQQQYNFSPGLGFNRIQNQARSAGIFPDLSNLKID